ncbi:MAG TPA: hypothetical protein VF084_01910 [Nitrososphaeraceae archaeon]
MKIAIPEHIKSAIIDSWLMGKTRDNIASEFNISKGSVSNIIDQWENRIGLFEANNLRQLGLALKKTGISPVQCVHGLRIYNIIKQLGIDEDHLFDFLTKVYNGSKEQKLLPADVVRLVQEVNSSPEINSLKEIPKNIYKRRQEKVKLDAEIYYKKLEIQKLDHEKERKRKEIQDLEDDLDASRKKMQDEKKDFLLFQNVKEDLKKHGIDIHILDPLVDVIKIFDDMHFRPLTILSEFSDINAYRELVKNKNREIKELESRIQDLKIINQNYEVKISSNEPMVLSIKQLENLGLNVSYIKFLEKKFSNFSKKFDLTKEEIKIRFFRYISRFDTLLTLEQDIFKKTDELSKLNSELASGRKAIEDQPIVFSILQYLLNKGLNENEILTSFKIFKTDLCNKMPYGDRTYLEHLSTDVDRYQSVRDTLEGLRNEILRKKYYIDKLVVLRSNLESFLLTLFITTLYFYSTLYFNAKQIRIQTNWKILSLLNFYYLPLLCIVMKEHKSMLDQHSLMLKQKNNKNKKRQKEKNKNAKKANKPDK